MRADPPELREFATRYAAAWCGQDPANVAEFYSPYGSLSVNGGPPAVGRKAIAEVARSFMTAFPDMRVVMDQVVVRDKVAEFHWTLSGTNSGPVGTGSRVHISGLERWNMGSDGLIAASQGHFDAREYERQLRAGR